MNRIVDKLDVSLCIVVSDIVPVDASMLDVDISLHADHCRHSLLMHRVNVLLILRVRPDKDLLIPYLLKFQSRHKISVVLQD